MRSSSASADRLVCKTRRPRVPPPQEQEQNRDPIILFGSPCHQATKQDSVQQRMAPLPCVRRSRRCSASATKLPCRRPPIPSTTGACAQADTDIVESDLNLNPLSPCTMYHPVFQVGQRNRQGLRPSVGEAARIQSSEDAHHSITTSCLPRFD